MTDKRLKWLNALLVVTAVYLCARSVYNLISPRFDNPSLAAPTAPAEPTPQARPARSISHYLPIIDRNLLNTNPIKAPKPGGLDIAALKKTDLGLKLLGTVTIDSDQRYAVIEEISRRQQQLFQEGSAVQNAVIKRIFREKVVLRVNGHDKILEISKDPSIIISGDTKPDIENESRRTALMDAVDQGSMDKIGLLIARGADVNALDSYSNTALMIAARSGNSDIVRLLIDSGADVNQKDHLGNTPLIDSARYASEFAHSVIEILIAEGADVQAKNKYGSTALMNAVRSGQSDVVELLLIEGAAVDARSKNGQTAFKLAADTLRKDLMAVLMGYGAIK